MNWKIEKLLAGETIITKEPGNIWETVDFLDAYRDGNLTFRTRYQYVAFFRKLSIFRNMDGRLWIVTMMMSK